MLSAVPSFATRRLLDLRTGLLPGGVFFFVTYLLACIIRRSLGSERLRHVLKVFATQFSPLSFRNEDSSGGGRLGYLAILQAYQRVYATAEAHDRQRTLDVEVWVARENSFK